MACSVAAVVGGSTEECGCTHTRRMMNEVERRLHTHKKHKRARRVGREYKKKRESEREQKRK